MVLAVIDRGRAVVDSVHTILLTLLSCSIDCAYLNKRKIIYIYIYYQIYVSWHGIRFPLDLGVLGNSTNSEYYHPLN